MPRTPLNGLIKIFSSLLSFGCYSPLCWCPSGFPGFFCRNFAQMEQTVCVHFNIQRLARYEFCIVFVSFELD